MSDILTVSDDEVSSDEPFVGGVDVVADETHVQHFSTTATFTSLAHDATPKKRRGRPPKAESEKKLKLSKLKPTGAIRISLSPKVKAPRVKKSAVPSTLASSNSLNSTPGESGRPRGRPRIHPPKDTSEKKPRGRPRKQPIEGEKAWQAECGRLRRVLVKKDALIKRLKQRLTDLGQSFEESVKEADDSEVNEDDVQNGVSDNGDSMEQSEVQSHMEDIHQKYVEMFARDGCQSNDDEDNAQNSESD